jgi:hypothetical protein
MTVIECAVCEGTVEGRRPECEERGSFKEVRPVGRQKKTENDRKLESKVGLGPPAPAMIGRRWGRDVSCTMTV